MNLIIDTVHTIFVSYLNKIAISIVVRIVTKVRMCGLLNRIQQRCIINASLHTYLI